MIKKSGTEDDSTCQELNEYYSKDRENYMQPHRRKDHLAWSGCFTGRETATSAVRSVLDLKQPLHRAGRFGAKKEGDRKHHAMDVAHRKPKLNGGSVWSEETETSSVGNNADAGGKEGTMNGRG
ncbi:unnamed protein product [Victoria cruziana]